MAATAAVAATKTTNMAASTAAEAAEEDEGGGTTTKIMIMRKIELCHGTSLSSNIKVLLLARKPNLYLSAKVVPSTHSKLVKDQPAFSMTPS